MTTAAAIDAALDAERSPRAIARFLGIPVSQVMARARLNVSPFEIERRRLEAAELEKRRIEREKARDARAMATAEADRLARRDEYTEWLAMPIQYEDHPRSQPFNYSRAIQNTMRLKPQRQSGGGVSNVYEAQGMDFHAGSKAA